MDSIWKRQQDVIKAKDIAKQYYDKETFEHAERVAEYVEQNEFIPIGYKVDCICLAWMHDLLEDTDYKNEPQFKTESTTYLNAIGFEKCLELLTRQKDMDYISYICKMKNENIPKIVRQVVWYVKLADIKDHLIQKDTLPNSLRDRYMWALSYLL